VQRQRTVESIVFDGVMLILVALAKLGPMQAKRGRKHKWTKVPGMFTSWVLIVSFLKNEEVISFSMDGNLG